MWQISVCSSGGWNGFLKCREVQSQACLLTSKFYCIQWDIFPGKCAQNLSLSHCAATVFTQPGSGKSTFSNLSCDSNAEVLQLWLKHILNVLHSLKYSLNITTKSSYKPKNLSKHLGKKKITFHYLAGSGKVGSWYSYLVLDRAKKNVNSITAPDQMCELVLLERDPNQFRLA